MWKCVPNKFLRIKVKKDKVKFLSMKRKNFFAKFKDKWEIKILATYGLMSARNEYSKKENIKSIKLFSMIFIKSEELIELIAF